MIYQETNCPENRGRVTSTIATISGVSLENGSASGPGMSGGGITNEGTLNLVRSEVSGNSAAAHGGGVFNYGTITIMNSTISGNRSHDGAGLFNIGGAHATLVKSTISDNSSAQGGFGGGVYNADTLSLTDSTVSGNSVGNTLSGSGGGIFNIGTLSVSNSTVSGNSANLNGFGGGLYINGGTLTLKNSTVASNSAGVGGAIYNSGSFSQNVSNSIIANSPMGGNCAGDPISSQGHNLSSDGSCDLAGVGDMNSIDPKLGPLADNGGATKTQALLSGSSAIDTGSTDCPPPSTDQRGILRPQDGDANGSTMCDVGSFELPPISQGDIDCSGAANAVDALKLLRHAAGLGASQNQPCPAIGDNIASYPFGDVDCSTTVNSVDALKVLRYGAGLSVAQHQPCTAIGLPLDG